MASSTTQARTALPSLAWTKGVAAGQKRREVFRVALVRQFDHPP